MTIRQSVHIEAPVEEVFDFFKDPKNLGDLMEGFVLRDVKVTKEGVGTTYAWIMKMGVLALEGFDVYTEVVPNRKITDRSSRFGTWTYSFEPDGSGMKLTTEVQLSSLWRIPPLEKLLARSMAKRSESFWPRVKARVEA